MSLPARAVACLLLTALPAAAADLALQDGLYSVDVRLELPHLEDMAATKSATVCVSQLNGVGTHGLVVLSDNNPLARCPASNVRSDGETLVFDIACAGTNAARATARYALEPQSFAGRITMKMGGKNMTMTEVQRGRRVGDCTAGSTPRS